MKKILSLCVAALAAITMTAQDIAVNIKLVAQSGGESTLLLASGTGVSSADNATLVAPLANTDNVAIYVQDDERYSIYATDGSFENLPIAFITDRMGAAAQSYTLHFEDVLAGMGTGSLTIKDLVTGDEQTIVDGESYGPFVVNTTNAKHYVAGTNTVIGNRFVINYNATGFVADVTTNAYGWASFSYDADLTLTLPAGLKIYKGAIAGDVLNLNEMNYVAVDEGVIVYGAPNTKYYFAAGSGSSDFSGNSLKPSSAWTSNTGNIYVLHDEALYQYTGSDMPANKAYLPLPGGASSAPKHIRMVINETEQTEAIDNVEAEAVKAEKFVEDGQIYIRRGNEVFNLQGQIVK